MASMFLPLAPMISKGKQAPCNLSVIEADELLCCEISKTKYITEQFI